LMGIILFGSDLNPASPRLQRGDSCQSFATIFKHRQVIIQKSKEWLIA